MGRVRYSPILSLSVVGAVLLLALPLGFCGPGELQDGEEDPAPGEEDVDPLAPGPLRAVAHLRGFRAESRLVIDANPTRPFELQVLYLFPDRSRWTIQPRGGKPIERASTFRFGGRAWKHSARNPSSTALEGDALDAQLLRMELRRAAFLWPDGFAWTDEESDDPDAPPRRVAEITAPGLEAPRPIGRLVATLDGEGRLAELASRPARKGKDRRLRIRAWQESQHRAWPRELELIEDGERVWTETVLATETRVSFLDRVFLPPDRRGEASAPIQEPRILEVELRAALRRTHPLPANTSWKEARARFAELLAAATRELSEAGLQPEAYPTFGLDAEGRPIRVVLTLAEPLPAKPPTGWTVLEKRPGRILLRDSLEGIDRGLLSRLGQKLPAGHRAGEPWLRIWEEGRIQLALPLVRQ